MEARRASSNGRPLRVEGLPPVTTRRARVLILGSMPGARSLAGRRYYVGPGNRFWTVMGRLLDFDPGLCYDERIEALGHAGVALWDVLRSCERYGSADARIVPGSEVANDFAGFFSRHPRVQPIGFNGKTAARAFERLVSADVVPEGARLVTLPSTSAANAAYGIADLVGAWRAVVTHSA